MAFMSILIIFILFIVIAIVVIAGFVAALLGLIFTVLGIVFICTGNKAKKGLMITGIILLTVGSIVVIPAILLVVFSYLA